MSTDSTTTTTDARPRELLQASNVKKHFPLDEGLFDRLFGGDQVVRAVDGVDLTVHAGETVGIVGESGSGKSTLGRTVSRLYEPTDGSIVFDSEHIETYSGRELRPIRRRVQYVFQDPMSALNPRKTVGESVARPLAVHDIADGEEKWERVADLFEEVGLSRSQLDAYPHELSGGQRQRVGLCRALVTEPDLIVFDEPVSALDVTLQAQILNLINRLQREFDLSYLFISHDLTVVRQVCDRIVVMYAGEIVERGTARDIFENPQHPYTRSLLDAIPQVDGGRRSDRKHLGGQPPSATNPPSGCRFHPRCPEFIDGRCSGEQPSLQSVEGDGPDHEAACHWLDPSEGERATHTPPSRAEREIIQESSGD
ncbi:ABC transporter ATP-binding protein [Haloplanus aerogenes]|uniref:ABC transporter ATP-binding protein n=1 Tax=Haloplanus aerogenes TaxID=660522 RepID=A0A3M0CSD1_9EURY|nr:ABC transporter ATP-binding protein [Haloplanus aerogenes]AZH26865.1 ABC transporter ATP-binding protein [Haloplanus aerogenes]RMB12514.1 peptide/nickel transport system ATP-binding protein/oligopeptide transport system ATP-binding protein [Haloplanus aerogenes]